MAENDRDTPQHSLDERAYRGDDGEIHHHTNTYMEQHGRGSGRSSSSGSESGSGRSSTERRESSGGGRGLPKKAIAAAAVGVAAVAAAAVVAGRRMGGRGTGDTETRDLAAGTVGARRSDAEVIRPDENRDFGGRTADSALHGGGIGSAGLDQGIGRDDRGGGLDTGRTDTGLSTGNRDGTMY